MQIALYPRDKGILTSGLAMLVKSCESISKNSERIGLATMAVESLKGQAESAKERVFGWTGETGVLEGDHDLPHVEVEACKVAVSLYLEKVSKVEDTQEELAIPTDETEARAGDARDLHDRLCGQTALQLAGR